MQPAYASCRLVEALGGRGLDVLTGIAKRHPDVIADARGLGLMLALELRTEAQAEALVIEAFRRGVLVLGAGRHAVRITPPLVIDAPTLDRGLEVLEDAVRAVARG
jgi:4-aminobutyrate aminotransferase-like enzyme